jgi:hypothetical protein
MMSVHRCREKRQQGLVKIMPERFSEKTGGCRLILGLTAFLTKKVVSVASSTIKYEMPFMIVITLSIYLQWQDSRLTAAATSLNNTLGIRSIS